jgi:type IV secretion system protein TrbL
MGDLNVIDRFTETFSRYIDSGFGLLGGEVAFLVYILVGIDIVLAGLFWALDAERNVIAQLIKKVLYVGFFALVLNNFALLADIVFRSFAGLGLEATGGTIGADDLIRPGFVAGAGFTAAHPLLEEARSLLGFTSFFNNVPTILILLFAWLVIILSFFILAVQIFITVIEFKLTTLAGFVLVPFALWNKTTFLAERVLGNVISAGIKVMVLAVIVGIGSTIFGGLTTALNAGPIDIERTMPLLLAALALLGLGIFGPGIAAGLVSGAPQLGAGAAVGTVAGLAAGTAAGVGLAAGAGRMALAGGGRSVRAASTMAGGASTAYGLARATSGASGMAGAAAGTAGITRAGAGAAAQGVRNLGARATEGVRASYRAGQRGAFTATGGAANSSTPSMDTGGAGDAAPAWARRMRAEQRLREAGMVTAHAIRDGDRPVSGDAPKLRDED